MASYLTFTGRGSECAGCGNEIKHALTGWTDGIEPPKIQPVCRRCLDGLEPKLRQVQKIVSEAGERFLREL